MLKHSGYMKDSEGSKWVGHPRCHTAFKNLLSGMFILHGTGEKIMVTPSLDHWNKMKDLNIEKAWEKHIERTEGIGNYVVSLASRKEALPPKEAAAGVAVALGSPSVWPFYHCLDRIISVKALTPMYFSQMNNPDTSKEI